MAVQKGGDPSFSLSTEFRNKRDKYLGLGCPHPRFLIAAAAHFIDPIVDHTHRHHHHHHCFLLEDDDDEVK